MVHSQLGRQFYHHSLIKSISAKNKEVISYHFRGGALVTRSTLVVSAIAGYQTNISFNVSNCKITKNVRLTDSLFHKPACIDILIGGGLFFNLMCVSEIHLAKKLPTLQKTLLG